MKKLSIFFSLVFFASIMSACSGGLTGTYAAADETLRIENGAAQPILTWSDLRAEDYTNEGSDILRFCVYVETDNDTDNDGLADLVKAFVQVPGSAAEGKYKAAVIYDPMPYEAGYIEMLTSDLLYEEKPFDYNILYKDCEKRVPASSLTTLEAADQADQDDWNYMIEGMESIAYDGVSFYDYFLVRGFAVVQACGIGTYGSEGFELCGTDLERDSHKCVVEWLTGKRKAYTDKQNNIEIKADWSNGNVAMSGCSYGGTIPFEVAATGVEGLKTIIPYAGIASWYDYTNSQGIPTRFDVNYTDSLAANNCAGVFTDDDMTELKPGYGSWLWQVAQDEDQTNGNYDEIWAIKDYSDDYENISCSALIVHGLNDYNVTTRQSYLMMQAFENAGQTAKLVLHQEEHTMLNGRMVNGELWEETLNKWLCHYLYGEDNGIEGMAQVTVQSNTDGSWKTYESWKSASVKDIPAVSGNKAETSVISSARVADFFTQFDYDNSDSATASEQWYYTSLDSDKAASYTLELPENTTIFGVPEIHTRLSTEDVAKDGLMITAVLVDTMDNGQEFSAFVPAADSEGSIPVEYNTTYERGGGLSEDYLTEVIKMPTKAKIVSYGWTDLQNPGCGPDSSEYVYQEDVLDTGKYYDYTFYMLPTVYTLEPGHHLTLVLTTWDPYRAFLDEEYNMNMDRDPKYSFYTYGFTVDNTALKVRIPTA